MRGSRYRRQCKSQCGCSSPFLIHLVGSACLCTCWWCPKMMRCSTVFIAMRASRNFAGCCCSSISESGIGGSWVRRWIAIWRMMTRKKLYLPNIVLFQDCPTRTHPGFSLPSAPPATQCAQFSRSSCTRPSPPIYTICVPALFHPDAWLRNTTCSRSGCSRTRRMPAGPRSTFRYKNGCSLVICLID